MKACKLVGLLFLLFVGDITLHAQQVRTVKGRVQTAETGSNKKQALPSASIIVMQKGDSVFIKGITSDKNGYFTLDYQAKMKKQYMLKVSFMWMQSVYRLLEDSVSVNVGRITLEDGDNQIAEVVVTGKMQEVEMEGDTTVINAAAYKTPVGAYMEDLVKRIPGLVYNKKDQSLTYNGQLISEINVNGEAFFSGNKKNALENLPADLISKLRVYNKKSKEEEFTGISSGEKKYVLDLQTKDELNKTWLTDATVGYGNNQKKDLEGQVNYFSKDGENLSFIGRSTNRFQNSTNKDNITNLVGMNMTHKFGKKFSLGGSLNYNLNRNGNISSTYQEQYLTAGNQYSGSTNEGLSKSRSIDSNIMGSWELDAHTRIHFNGDFSFSPNWNENNSQNASFDAPLFVSHESLFDNFESIPHNTRVNRSENQASSESQSNRYNWTVEILRRLNEKGTTLGLNIQNSDSWNDNKTFSLSKTTYFRFKDELGNDSLLYRNQYSESPQKNNSWRIGINFTQPIGKKMHLRAAYNLNTHYERDSRDTYELSSLVNSDLFGQLPPNYETGYVDSLNNRSYSRTDRHGLNIGFNYSDDTWMFNASLGITPQKRTIERKIGMSYKDTTVHTIDFQPMIWLTWRKNEVNFTFNYDGRTRQPSLSDLMAQTDNSNPLYITRGNPNLKQMFVHNLQIGFQHTKKAISTNIGGQLEQNSITQVVIYDAQTAGRETYPININGNWNVYVSANWWKRLGHFSLRFDMNGNHNNRVSMINDDRSFEPVKSITRDNNLNCEANVSYLPTWGGNRPVNFLELSVFAQHCK